MGLTTSDLQADIEINGTTISGTSNYVTGYTGFSGDTDEQSGNYLALHVKGVNCDSMKAGLDPSQGTGMFTIPNNEDDVVLLLNPDVEQTFVIQLTRDGETTEIEYTLDILCENPPEDDDTQLGG